jgi:hypothetical protein
LQKEEEERRAKEEEERLLVEEQARAAKRPRHQDLDLTELAGDATDAQALPRLRTMLAQVTDWVRPRKVGDRDAFVFDDDEDEEKEDAELADLKSHMQALKVVSRAKVTQDRVYSCAYHPEPTKDLVFFGDKHGMLGIWDARAPADEVGEDEEDDRPIEEREGGKYWRLQLHWPATSKSSISSIKLDPVDSHSVRHYCSRYNSTLDSSCLIHSYIPPHMIVQYGTSLSSLVFPARFSRTTTRLLAPSTPRPVGTNCGLATRPAVRRISTCARTARERAGTACPRRRSAV